MDPAAPQARAGRRRMSRAILDYYRYVDGLSRLLRHADDETAVLVVSGSRGQAHGRRHPHQRVAAPRGAARRSQPSPKARSSSRECGIDWPRTLAWADGGYYSPRLPQRPRARAPGTIPPDRVRGLPRRARLSASGNPDELGRPIPTKVFRPEDVYPEVKGVAPDLIVHFGDLHWRSVGTVGGDEGLHTFDNDTGPDDANHAQHGLFILRLRDRAGPREGGTCSTSRRPCWSCSASPSRRPCAARACSSG